MSEIRGAPRVTVTTIRRRIAAWGVKERPEREWRAATMSICEATGRAASAETGFERSGCDAGDGEVTGALMTMVTGGDLETAWNVGEYETAIDGRKRGESQNEGLLACWAHRAGNVGS
jgi:hypothetical protein